jgi:hypothetical protein
MKTANKALFSAILIILFSCVCGRAGDLANEAPMVRFMDPQDGQSFVGPTDLRLAAYVQDLEDGYRVKVEFFEGTNSLGFGTFVTTLFCPSQYCPNFVLAWSNVTAGAYTLSAVATDSAGASTRSEAVQIKITELQRPPIVTIIATDPTATEQSPLVDAAPDTAIFVVRRSGADFDNLLTVSYRIGGTASNGVDYEKLSGQVTIAARAETAEIVVNPIDDNLPERTETVLLTLLPGYPPCLFGTPPCEIPMPAVPAYYVGFPGEAVAFIRDNEPANQRPRVAIIKPQNGEAFAPSSSIEIGVRAQDPDGWVHSVQFFANGEKIGEQSIEFIQAPPPGLEQMFSLVWSNVTTGRYVLTARAIDDDGSVSTSEPISIVVGDVPPLVPIVRIIASDSLASERVSTNGTNTATFRIYRTGPTNLDLTVFYSAHGTASNGVDYLETGNSVTIPAGRYSARVMIVPIDDDLEEVIETVILKLEPDPTLGPVARYEIGRPGRAAAIIVDNDQCRPSCLRLPDGSYHLCVDKPDGFAFSLEVSEDLSTWVSLYTNVVTDGALRFVDPEALQHSRRFYRIVPQSNYVPEE